MCVSSLDNEEIQNELLESLIILPNNLPKSEIISENEACNGTLQHIFINLYEKYIDKELAEHEINIGSNSRKIITNVYENLIDNEFENYNNPLFGVLVNTSSMHKKNVEEALKELNKDEEAFKRATSLTGSQKGNNVPNELKELNGLDEEIHKSQTSHISLNDLENNNSNNKILTKQRHKRFKKRNSKININKKIRRNSQGIDLPSVIKSFDGPLQDVLKCLKDSFARFVSTKSYHDLCRKLTKSNPPLPNNDSKDLN